jgi:hypothetical protein
MPKRRAAGVSPPVLRTPARWRKEFNITFGEISQ